MKRLYRVKEESAKILIIQWVATWIGILKCLRWKINCLAQQSLLPCPQFYCKSGSVGKAEKQRIAQFYGGWILERCWSWRQGEPKLHDGYVWTSFLVQTLTKSKRLATPQWGYRELKLDWRAKWNFLVFIR